MGQVKALNIGIAVLGLMIAVRSMPKGLEATVKQAYIPPQPQELGQQISQELGQQISQEIAGATPAAIETGMGRSAEVEISGATPELESQIRNDIASLPRLLRSSVKKINITPNIGIPDARGEPAGASATHENGKPLFITFYEGSKNYNYDTLVHEAAHQLAAKTWGTSTPPKEYKQLFKAEGGVTPYGSSSSTEDFAEAVRLHTTGRLQTISPGKDAYISNLLTK